MSDKALPQKIDANRFAENAIHMEGKLKISDVQRLTEFLAEKVGEVDVILDFGVDEQKVHFIRGDVQANLLLKCQRCMENFKYTIHSNFLLGMVNTEEEMETLPKGYDAVLVKEGMVMIQDVIEDELIVSLPIVPMHNAIDCQVKLPLEIHSQSPELEKENPFKVIELLRSKRSSND